MGRYPRNIAASRVISARAIRGPCISSTAKGSSYPDAPARPLAGGAPCDQDQPGGVSYYSPLGSSRSNRRWWHQPTANHRCSTLVDRSRTRCRYQAHRQARRPTISSTKSSRSHNSVIPPYSSASTAIRTCSRCIEWSQSADMITVRSEGRSDHWRNCGWSRTIRKARSAGHGWIPRIIHATLAKYRRKRGAVS